MRRYAIAIYRANGNYSAHALDVDGCVATGKTVEETISNMREALEFHFEAMVEDGETIPNPVAVVDYVDIDVGETVKRKLA